MTGKLYLGQNENLKSTKIIAQLEKEHSLTPTAQQRDPEALNRKTITTGEKGIETRTGEPTTRKQLQTIIDQASADKPSFWRLLIAYTMPRSPSYPAAKQAHRKA